VYGPQSGTDWVTSTLIVPLNGFAITTPRRPISLGPTWINSDPAPGPHARQVKRVPADDT
jgi:hypothetical protein